MKREIEGKRYKVWKLPNLILVHWILNPGIAIVELIFGQRTPKVILIDQESSDSLFHRQYVECPHCGKLTNAIVWQNAKRQFGNWYGLACPNCEEKIPTLLNVFSRIILLPLFPVLKPIEKALGSHFLVKQASALREAEEFPPTKIQTKHKSAKHISLKLVIVISFLYFLMFLVQIYFKYQTLELLTIVIAAAYAIFGGILYYKLSSFASNLLHSIRDKLSSFALNLGHLITGK